MAHNTVVECMVKCWIFCQLKPKLACLIVASFHDAISRLQLWQGHHFWLLPFTDEIYRKLRPSSASTISSPPCKNQNVQRWNPRCEDLNKMSIDINAFHLWTWYQSLWFQSWTMVITHEWLGASSPSSCQIAYQDLKKRPWVESLVVMITGALWTWKHHLLCATITHFFTQKCTGPNRSLDLWDDSRVHRPKNHRTSEAFWLTSYTLILLQLLWAWLLLFITGQICGHWAWCPESKTAWIHQNVAAYSESPEAPLWPAVLTILLNTSQW